MPMTFVEKVIAARLGEVMRPGDVAAVTPDVVVVPGEPPAWAQDSWPAPGPRIYPGRGPGGCVDAVHEGWVLPGQVFAGPPPEARLVGALGAMGLGVTDWNALADEPVVRIRVPQSLRVVLRRRLARPGLEPDAGMFLVSHLQGALREPLALEFHGSVGTLSVEGRFELAAVVSPWVDACAFPVDHAAREWLAQRGKGPDAYEPVWADVAATYAAETTVDLASVEPTVVWEGHAIPAQRVVGQPIGAAVLAGPVGGSPRGLGTALEVLGEGRVRVPLVVVPVSHRVLREARGNGVLAALEARGATVVDPGQRAEALVRSLPTPVAVADVPAPGTPGACYASPRTVAGSALEGRLVLPG